MEMESVQSRLAQLHNMVHNSSLDPGKVKRFSAETVPQETVFLLARERGVGKGLA
jgi:hypothetical protein